MERYNSVTLRFPYSKSRNGKRKKKMKRGKSSDCYFRIIFAWINWIPTLKMQLRKCCLVAQWRIFSLCVYGVRTYAKTTVAEQNQLSFLYLTKALHRITGKDLWKLLVVVYGITYSIKFILLICLFPHHSQITRVIGNRWNR